MESYSWEMAASMLVTFWMARWQAKVDECMKMARSTLANSLREKDMGRERSPMVSVTSEKNSIREDGLSMWELDSDNFYTEMERLSKETLRVISLKVIARFTIRMVLISLVRSIEVLLMELVSWNKLTVSVMQVILFKASNKDLVRCMSLTVHTKSKASSRTINQVSKPIKSYLSWSPQKLKKKL